MTDGHRQAVFDALGLTPWQRRAGGPLGPPNRDYDAAREACAAAHDVDAEAEAKVADMPAATSSSSKCDEYVPDAAAGDCAGLDWDELEAYLERCDHRGASQPVFGVGARTADVLIVGEAPGAEEDRQGEPFVGRSGRLLDQMLAEIDCSRTSNVFITNICKFRPPDNRDPTAAEVAADWPILERQIELMAPKLVVATGRVAAQTLLASTVSLGRLRGQRHRYPGRDLDVIVTYHPAFLLRSPQQKAKAWIDLCAIADCIETAAL
ncbi:uracil-DNA glycosylase [Salinisphaera sp. USBA-960]|uniref:uracil-DNA glycosylase n=1 Tax=Salinisphaera orenii TaxID=856731 RepID=UPI000DBE8E26|nr:uracil-DNA glycosylase [Salifodinibacter halophilus]NNC25473.1 uracil-DNA glycosylase [Salifodinibacter halophilus]